MPLQNLDDGPPPGELQIFAYAGDGSIDTAEYDMGTLHTTATGLTGAYPVVSLDVTALVQAHLANGDAYLAIRFEGIAGGDRYRLGAGGGVEMPSLTVAP